MSVKPGQAHINRVREECPTIRDLSKDAKTKLDELYARYEKWWEEGLRLDKEATEWARSSLSAEFADETADVVRSQEPA